MAKNMARYYQAWKLRQRGKKFREIGNIMYISSERARTLVSYINMKIQFKKPLSNELRLLIKKFRPQTNWKKRKSKRRGFPFDSSFDFFDFS